MATKPRGLTQACGWCGTPKSVRKGRRYCSRGCAAAAKTRDVGEGVARVVGTKRVVQLPPRRPKGARLVAKTCTGCGHLKDTSDFPTTGSFRTPDPKCRACHAQCRRGAEIEFPPKPWGRTVLAASCRVCFRLLPPTEFPLTRAATDWQCRDCAVDRTRQWRVAHPERREQHARQSKRRADLIGDQAKRRGYVWTGPEIETAARDDLTVPEVALLLGRTVHGVRNIRRQLKDDPRKQAFL